MDERPLSDIAAALRSGEESSKSLFRQAEICHEKWKQKLNAFKIWDSEKSLERAKIADVAFTAGNELGPLQGIPIAIKDLYGVPGLPTFAGSAMPLPSKWEKAGPVVAEIQCQLGNIVGKTHTVEFAFGGLGDNPHWGAPRNPWDAVQHRSPGGSSSGAAACLWEGSALVAFGTDTMGSVRIPAAMNGVVGLKLTHGRWSNKGIVPLLAEVDTPGPLVRSVADAAYVFVALDPALHGNSASNPTKIGQAEIDDFRIGIADDCFWQDCDHGIVECVRKSISELEKSGATIVDAPSSETAELMAIVMAGGVPYREFADFLDNELPEWVDRVGAPLKARLKKARGLSTYESMAMDKRLNGLAESARKKFTGFDVIVSPTVPVSPPIMIDGVPKIDATDWSPIINARNTSPVNLFRQCAITLPVGLDGANMPVGLQVIAQGGQEEKLLSAALAMESVLGKCEDRLGFPPFLGI